MPGIVAWTIDLVTSFIYLAAAVTMLGTAFVVVCAIVLTVLALRLLLLVILVVPCEFVAVMVPGAAPVIRRWVRDRVDLVRNGPPWWKIWRRN